MNPARWDGFRTVIFDCDSTLTRVEGIDELGRLKGRGAEVAELTRRAMDGEAPLQDVYRARLAMLRPTRADLTAVAERYIAEAVSDARETVGLLRALGRDVYIVSAGLEPPVAEFARWLGVDAAHVRAVRPMFGADGAMSGYEDTPLAHQHGKLELIAALPKAGRSLLVGDGMNDCTAREAVDLFIGFGGVARREAVACASEVYITACTVAPVLPFALTPGEAAALDGEARALFGKGLRAVEHGATGAPAAAALRAFADLEKDLTGLRGFTADQ